MSSKKEAQSLENEFTFPDGSIGWFDLKIESVPEGVFILSSDITDRKKAEKTLKESEQRWATTVSSIGDAIITTDLSGKVTFLNGVAESLTGWTMAEALRRPIKEVFRIVNEQTRIEVESPVTRVLKEGMVIGLANHTILLRKDGSEVPIDDSGAPIKDKAGKISGVVLIFRDISERKKSEEKLAQQAFMIANANDAIIGYSLDQKVTFWNKSAEKLYGYTSEEAMGKASVDLLKPAYINIPREKLINQLSREGHAETESVRQTKDGKHLDIDAHVILLRNEARNSIGYVSVDRDITERKRAEDALNKLNRHLRAISNSNQALMHATDEAALTKEVCDIVNRDCGYSLVWVGFAEHDKNKTVRPVAYSGLDKEYIDGLKITWADKPRGRGPTGMVIRTGKPYVCRNMQNDPNFEPWRVQAEKRKYTASLVLPLVSFQGNTFGALNIYSREPDPFSEEEIKLLTELANDFAYGVEILRLRKEKEQADETLRKQASIIDLSPDAIIVRKLDGEINLWSAGAEKLYGWTKTEALGQNTHSLLNTKFPEPLNEIVAELKQKGKWSGELSHETKDGRNVVVQSYWLAKKDEQGKIIELLESNVNVTDRKQMQVKLEEYAAHLEELVQERTQQLKDTERLTAIGETAGMVGHDLRNPLQTVTGETFLARGELNQLPESEAKNNLAESINTISEQISYMDKIVSDLQDFVRPITPEKRPINLGELLTVTVAEVKIPENIEIETEISQKLPEISADAQLLKRVFINLVTNAVQAMPQGGKLVVKTKQQKKTRRGSGKVFIQVQDNGEGIPENVKPKIFRPLFTTKSKGQGFGLAVCKRVIEAHGGNITFQSQQGKGSTFTVELPT